MTRQGKSNTELGRGREEGEEDEIRDEWSG